MRDEYDFTGAQKNPYATKLKEETAVVLDDEVAAYITAHQTFCKRCLSASWST